MACIYSFNRQVALLIICFARLGAVAIAPQSEEHHERQTSRSCPSASAQNRVANIWTSNLIGKVGYGMWWWLPHMRLHSSHAMSAETRPSARRQVSNALNRLKPSVIDPLEAVGLPSKGDTRYLNLELGRSGR